MAPGHGMVAAMAAAASGKLDRSCFLWSWWRATPARRSGGRRGLLSSCSYDVIRGGSADKGERRSFILGVNGHGDIIIP